MSSRAFLRAASGPLLFAACALIACNEGDAPRARSRSAATVAPRIAKRFQEIVDSRHPPGTRGVKRAVFLKPHGCARAEFLVPIGLPERLRVGVFAQTTSKPAWIRFSSDTVPATSDHDNKTIGFALKVLEVPGQKLLPGEENFLTQDFLLQNHHVFFVDTAQDFFEFTESIFTQKLQQYLQAHPTTDRILNDMDKQVANVLATRFFSTTPYRFGAADHVKYSVRPCAEGPVEEPPAPSEPNYLRKRLARDVAAYGACFLLEVQLRHGDMPLDQATVEWSESVSPPETVAMIVVPPQEIDGNEQDCEDMSFTAWHALPDHQPVGSVNEARGIVYKMLADVRRMRNGVVLKEPEPPAPVRPTL